MDLDLDDAPVLILLLLLILILGTQWWLLGKTVEAVIQLETDVAVLQAEED
jgi:cell division protein FtsB